MTELMIYSVNDEIQRRQQDSMETGNNMSTEWTMLLVKQVINYKSRRKRVIENPRNTSMKQNRLKAYLFSEVQKDIMLILCTKTRAIAM